MKALSDKLCQLPRCEKCRSKDEEEKTATDVSGPETMTSENGELDASAKIVEEMKQAASEVARYQFLKVKAHSHDSNSAANSD